MKQRIVAKKRKTLPKDFSELIEWIIRYDFTDKNELPVRQTRKYEGAKHGSENAPNSEVGVENKKIMCYLCLELVINMQI